MTTMASSGSDAAELGPRIAALMPRAKADLAELVAIPSVADPRQYPPEECTRAAQWVADAFTRAGLRDVHLAETPDGSHAVLGHRPPPPGAPTVLLYCHYDVQPHSTTPPGTVRRSPSPSGRTAAGTGAAPPTARATSSCTSPHCARSARTCRWG